MDINDKRNKYTTTIIRLEPGDLFYFEGNDVQSIYMKTQHTTVDLRTSMGYVKLLGGTLYTAKNNPNIYQNQKVIKVQKAELNILD